MSRISSQDVIQHPRDVLETLTVAIEGRALAPSFQGQAYLIVALYGVVVLCAGAGMVNCLKDGRLFTHIASNGRPRVNGAAFMQLCQMIYSLSWIVNICFIVLPVNRDVARGGTVAFQLILFLPLSFSGWMSTWMLLTALPTRRALLHFHDQQRISRIERVLESDLFLRLFAFAIPSMTVCMVVPPSILAGLAQRRLWRHWYAARNLLATAAQSEWTGGALQAVSVELREIEREAHRLENYSSWASRAFMFWAVAFTVFYVPITWRLIRIVSQQIRLLRRSISNLVTLHQLALAPPSCPPTPLSASPSALLAHDHKESIGNIKCSSEVGQDSYAKHLEDEGFQSQLDRAMQMRTILAFSAVATLSTVTCFLVMSILGVVNPTLQTSANAQAINIFVPAYPYLIPVIPCSILFVLTTRESRPVAGIQPTPKLDTEWIPRNTPEMEVPRSEPVAFSLTTPPLAWKRSHGQRKSFGTTAHSTSTDTSTGTSTEEADIALFGIRRGPPSSWGQLGGRRGSSSAPR